MLIIEAVLGTFTLGIGSFITGIVFSFIYNKLYIKELIEKGYQPATEADSAILRDNQITA